MSAANRSRGARAEVQVVNYLRDHGYPDARRYLAGDGRQPGDIDFHPLVCLEAKDVARSAWPSWCRQAAAEARPGMIPAVIRRTRGVPDVGVWELRVRCQEWWRVFDLVPPELAPWAYVPHDDGSDPWARVTLPVLLDALHDIDHQDAT